MSWWPMPPLLCGHHRPVRDRVSPIVGTEAPGSVSEQRCGAGRTGDACWERSHVLSVAPRELSPEVPSLVLPVTCCMGSQGSLLPAPPSATPQPWECQQLASVSLRLCTHEASVTDPLASATRATLAVHLELLWELPAPPVRMHAKPAGPTPVAGARVIHSDIP